MLLLAGTGGAANAATITVNANGDLQLALNAAQPGDVILLAAGATFSGNFILPKKAGAGAAIVVRSSAADAVLPIAGERIRPAVHAQYLPKLRSPNSLPALRTAASASGWTIRVVEFLGNQGGFGDIIALGSGDASVQTSLSQVPTGLAIDRCYVHGDPLLGQKRGIALNSGATSITNSYISDIKASGLDSQAIAGWNGPGPFTITNNYLEASTENVLFGGADPGIANLVPSNITFKGNRVAKPEAWRNPILAAPAGVKATVDPGASSFAKGTYYYTVVATRKVALDVPVFSVASTQLTVTVPDARKSVVTIAWNADPAATSYRVYRSTDRRKPAVYFETTSTSLIDTGGSSGLTGSVPSPGRWLVKNLFELKNAQDVVIDGNVFEYNWTHGQVGYAILFTPRNQDGTAPWSVVQRVSFTNNIVRHSAGGMNVLGTDDLQPSGQTNTLVIRNNLFDDLGRNGYWGENLPWLLFGGGGTGYTIDHNTTIHTGTSLVYFYGAQDFVQFAYANNMGRHNEYGFMGESRAPGNDTINAYLSPPYTLTRSVVVAGTPSWYPATNQQCGTATCFPSEAAWESGFANFGAADYHLTSASSYAAAGTDGKDLGANIDALPK
jgi:hypothetical protein